MILIECTLFASHPQQSIPPMNPACSRQSIVGIAAKIRRDRQPLVILSILPALRKCYRQQNL
jgi:hypothetical protein